MKITEGTTLGIMIVIMVTGTLALNILVQVFIG